MTWNHIQHCFGSLEPESRQARDLGENQMPFLLKECSNKVTSNNILLYLYSAILIDQPSPEKLPLATETQSQTVSRPWHTQSYKGSFKSLLLRFRELCGTRGGKSIRARGNGGHQETRPSRFNRVSAHANSTK